jgi:unsaturated rhamnogalacturonyl hydrolase
MRKLLCLTLLAATPLLAQTTAQDAATMAAQARAVDPKPFAYESGVLLDGLAAQWQATADGADFAAIKAAVDKWVAKDGTLIPGEKGPFKPEAHSLDNLEPGRAVLLCYRVTGDARYYKAAKFLYEQFATQPRTPEGGYWHKQIYPQQMWLDGAYMGEPFRAAYAATFQDTAAFDDIAHQFLLMHQHLRDPKTGLLRHGWDSAHTQPWADKQTGMSQESWARAVGWYAVALVDTLQWFPADHKDRPRLIAVLNDVADSIAKTQQPSGVWMDVLSQPKRAGNFEEASASEMFVYSLAKGVRLGYLPVKFAPIAQRGWKGIETRFVTREGSAITLHGTVKVSGLGGSPYRAGDYNYYIHEERADNETKGVGAYLMAASEMQQADSATAARGKTVVMDAWFNSQTRKNAAGQTELFHYKWNDDANSGFAFFCRAFQRFGAKLSELAEAPTAANLRGASVYVIASPDIPVKNPTPHYMDKASGDAIEAWVRAGGVLLLMENDVTSSEFEHFNTLSERFGIHFNPVLRNTVEGNHFEQGALDIPAGTGGIFPQALHVYMKEICTIKATGAAKSIYTDKGDTLMAVAHVGKGTVYAVVDPWLYNEYTDGRKLPPEFQDFPAAIDLARWSLAQAK